MQMTTGKLRKLITKCLSDLYKRRMQKIEKLKLKTILRRKNPYLYKALGTESATEIIERILAAYISSSDETMFGDAFFEPIAKAVSGCAVSPSEGVDIALETDSKYIAFAIKSGPNIFNSSQKKRQNDEFLTLRSRLMKIKKQFDPVLAHCYGRKHGEPDGRKIYREISGQEFWEEITGDSEFYKKLIRHIRSEVVTRNRQEYKTAWGRAVNRYVGEFTNMFCDKKGAIDWEKLLEFNSGKKEKN